MGEFKIALGAEAVDSITDFRGTVTGRVEYMTGCREYVLTPKAKKNKTGTSEWFDEDRLLVKKVAKKKKKGNDGGPQAFEPPTK